MITRWLRNIKYGVRNLWRWRKIIWADRDWDWAYLYQIMEFKLLRMAELHRKYGHCTEMERVASELEEAAKLLRKVYLDDYDYDKLSWEEATALSSKDLEKFTEMFKEKSRDWWD